MCSVIGLGAGKGTGRNNTPLLFQGRGVSGTNPAKRWWSQLFGMASAQEDRASHQAEG